MKRELVVKQGRHRLGRACAALAVVAGALALPGSSAASAQDTTDCETSDLGTLAGAPGSTLETTGRWTTEDCDSRFRADSDAHTYRFEIAETGRVRIDLSSADADPYLYLLDEDGSRLGFNDDGGVSLAARIERDLAPGPYLIEATTSTGRQRGHADFALTVSRVEGCDPIHLGMLEPGKDLTASGFWTRDSCGSRIEAVHPATTYVFSMAEAGRVRIDLGSEDGADTVLSLASLADSVIGANDDGGEGRGSRIDKLLPAGTYFIEATTYWERDFHALQADYTLTVHLVDEQAEQQAHKLKVETVRVPAEVVAGDLFDVDFRVGNLGGELPEGAYARLYVTSRGVYERSGRLRNIWHPGASYHTSENVASSTSTEISAISPVEIAIDEIGPQAVKVYVLTWNQDFNEIGYRFFAQPLTVLSGPTFGPVDVLVDGKAYVVSAEADDAEADETAAEDQSSSGDENAEEDSNVTTSVRSAADPDAEVDEQVESKAIYTAGVLTQMLDGVSDRPAISELFADGRRVPFEVDAPSSISLLDAMAQRYLSDVSASGLLEAMAARELINPVAIEELVLDAADRASSHFAAMAASWRAHHRRLDIGETLSFDDALEIHSQVNYVERLVGPAVAAGKIVDAARTADAGWQDRHVQAMIAGGSDCRPGADEFRDFRDALEAAGAADVDALLDLDAEMRLLRPVYGLAVDNALCGIAAVDAANDRFLERLAIGDSDDLRDALGLVEEPEEASAPEPHRLRIIARHREDGRLELGIRLASGEQVLPSKRFLTADAPKGEWQVTGDVEVDGASIGRIRAQRLDHGRVEIGFLDLSGEAITPNFAYLPANMPKGVWFRSSEIEVAAALTGDDL